MSTTDFVDFAERVWAETQARYITRSRKNRSHHRGGCGDVLWNKIYEEVCEEFRNANHKTTTPHG